MRINLILLAAGNSKRFNGNKLLAIYKDKPIYMHIVEKVLGLEFNKIICVTQYEEIRKNSNIIHGIGQQALMDKVSKFLAEKNTVNLV